MYFSTARLQILRVCKHQIKIIFKNDHIKIFDFITGANNFYENGEVILLNRISKYKEQH